MIRNARNIRFTRRGQRLTAAYLNTMAAAVNDNSNAIASPKQKRGADIDPDALGGLTDLVFTETARTETTEEITDSGGDTHDIEQMDQVTLQNASGETLILIFNNP